MTNNERERQIRLMVAAIKPNNELLTTSPDKLETNVPKRKQLTIQFKGGAAHLGLSADVQL